MTDRVGVDMAKSRGILRPRSMPIMEWLLLNSHEEPGPLDTPCVIWDRARDGGYGSIRFGGRNYKVHRLAWTERYGPIPDATPCVLHHCDNPPCWADGHHFLGTRADNVADMIAKGRYRGGRQPLGLDHCVNGHLYDAVNTYIAPATGERFCRACRKAFDHRRYQRLCERRQIQARQ